MKVSLLASVFAALAMNGSIMIGANADKLPARDTRVIVELDAGLDGYTDKGVENIQNSFISSIRSNITENFKVLKRYSVLNNAVALAVNSNDVEKIKNMPGVASVTKDTIHWKRNVNNDETIEISAGAPADVGIEENISATTMHKPTDTNDGEGTVIAILDNEFWLKGETADSAAWCHEVFSPLEEGTIERFTFDNLKNVVTKTNAKKSRITIQAGKEGSLYFNNKVPFYYDYGGQSESYGSSDSKPDYDVSSTTDYHGSHVASIAAANAPTYKGIAPKAQLACMKVFTEYEADDLGKNLGFQNASGAYDMVILSALEDCITLGVDGINMSLGSDLDDFDSESITLKTLTKLCNQGILTSISAGNSGKTSYSFTGGYGNWTTDMVETGILSSYANNTAVTTIASGQPDRVFYENAININGHNVAYEDQIINREGVAAEYNEEFKMIDLKTTYGRDDFGYVYVPGFGTNADYASIDADGKVAVVNRGSTSFASKYQAAIDHGAIAVVIINNDPTSSDFNFRCSFGDGFNPTVPCALVLYKDKPFFEANKEGTFSLLFQEVSNNDQAKTISTFSSDGARFDYELKPEITAPGDIIRGAVPPQKKEDRQNTPYSTYKYLSGTSMSAPNHAGAQSVVASKVAKNTYSGMKGDSPVAPTAAAVAEYKNYRNTVDMRLQSTAVPMLDASANPEDGAINYSSPRLQGAGMVNLGAAYNTDVYLEGYDVGGKLTNKSKISLRNNADIAKGDIKLSFMAHNEAAEAREYAVKVTVMRPAIAASNKVISKEYNYRGEVEKLESIPGIRYYDVDEERMTATTGSVKDKYVYKLTKQIEYYASEADFTAGNKVIMPAGYWTYVAKTGKWIELPTFDYQSVQDVVICEKTLANISIPANSNKKIDLSTISLTDEQKEEILETFEYGCAIEGFVKLTPVSGTTIELGIPFLGFYSGTDKDSTKSYESAPVVEPFNFEKSNSQIYPSDLANDIAKSLVGKDKGDMGSMMVVGYAEEPQAINTDKARSNDISFEKLNGFHALGVNPINKSYLPDAVNNLYLGNPDETNTLIIQQFVLRSVADNFFTIKNKETGAVAYKSVLEDMLYGEQNGKYPLYKSHVDSSYLGNGIVCHRAYAVVPLYDELTREAFADGTYEIEFNYKLAATGNWVKKAYTLHIDSTVPEFQGIKEYAKDGVQRVRVDFKDFRAYTATVGYDRVDVYYDETLDTYYIDETKEFFQEKIEEIGATISEQKRIYINMVDYAFGQTGVIIHLEDFDDFNSDAITAEGKNIKITNDFVIDEEGKVSFISISAGGDEEEVTIEGVTMKGVPEIEPIVDPTPSGGCAGNATTSCALIAITASLSLIMLFFFRRKKQLGGN